MTERDLRAACAPTTASIRDALEVVDRSATAVCLLVDDEGRLAGLLTDGDLAGQDVTKGSKCVVKSLVVNGLVEVLDEDVALTSPSEGWVSLRPHDSAWSTSNDRVVELLESSLTVVGIDEVDVGVSQ